MSTGLALAVTPRASAAAIPQDRQGYLQKPWPILSIVASFLLLTLPLSLAALADPSFLTTYRWPISIYVCVLGTTHFIITLTIYCQSTNLRYFNSSWRNRICYFLIPLLIFVLFDLYSALQIAILFPAFALVFRAMLRLLDFHHFTRQSFGVTQVFKGRARAPFPAWAKKAENWFFMTMTLVLFVTFLRGGQFDGTYWLTWALLAMACVLGVGVVAGFLTALRHANDPRALWAPMAFFAVHAAALTLAAYNTSLYVFALAIHYVEYHVLMAPRCFDSVLDPTQPVDRFFARLRRNRVVFYGVVLLAAGLVYGTTLTSMGSLIAEADRNGTPAYLVLISLFDGLFVFHYFIEAFIWKFSDPFYRQTLGPLYFGPPKPKPSVPVSLGV